MATNNPMAGGPDYIRALASILNHNPVTLTPPASGGDQMSVRLTKDLAFLLDTLVEESGWNRNQVLVALLHGGLHQFFTQLQDETAEQFMETLAIRRIAKMTTLSIAVSYGDRRQFDELLWSWANREPHTGTVLSMSLPAMGGPDVDGKVTFHGVPKGFLPVLNGSGIAYTIER